VDFLARGWLREVPNLAKRPCSVPGCGVLVASGRCEKHAQQLPPPRGKTAERGYGGDHRKLRVPCFERDQWKCVDCGWEPAIVEIFRKAGMPFPPSDRILEELRANFAANMRHLHADHEIPIEDRPDLRLDLDNLRTRCNVCHSAKTSREDHGFGNR
jgi:hypothetical protein